MLEKVQNTIKTHELIPTGSSVLCGVSGGADSVALLHVLKKLSTQMGFTLSAAHFNHCIRGDESDNDEAFVRKLCDEFGIELFVKKYDVTEHAHDNGLTLETAGRLLRYDFFDSLGFDLIAVAHHMDDQAESVLMHLIRGSGLSGLCGMKYRRDNIIRPLLDVRRYEIEEYCKIHALEYCTDATNFLTDCSRNRLRLDVIPYITENLNHGFVPLLCGMSGLLAEDEEYLCNQAMDALTNSACDDGYRVQALKCLPNPILSRAIRIAIAKAGAVVDIEHKHIVAVCGVLNDKTRRISLDLPKVTVTVEYGIIRFTCASNDNVIHDNIVSEVIPLTNDADTVYNGYIVSTQMILGNSFVPDPNVAFADADKLFGGDKVVIRLRQNGDSVNPVGAPGTKKIKSYFIDKKVPIALRNSLPLICCGSSVLIVPGMCVSKEVAVTASTRRMLRITVSKKN